MKKRGCGINVIIEGLVVNRHGIITESAEEQVQKDIKKFLKDRGVSGLNKKRFYTLLTVLYSLCNDAGPYKFIKDDFTMVKGGVEDASEFEAPIINPTLYEMSYDIKFLSAVDIKALYKQIYNSFKSIPQNYELLDIDSFAITVCFSKAEADGLYLAIEKGGRAIRVRIGYQTFVIEGRTGAFGTEIGLPIDHDNSESTGIGGVSTPSGGFSNDKEKEKKKLIPIIDSGEEKSEEGKDTDSGEAKSEDGIERLTCPKCKSPNVNSDGENIVCSDCSYSWTLKEDDEDIRDNMLPQDDDVFVSDVQRTSEDLSDKNEVECLQTQQNTPKSL